MKKNLLLVVALVVILSLCLSSTVFAAEPLKVGLVFDIGGKGDKSFNDSASRGLSWAAADFGIKRIELEPGVDADSCLLYTSDAADEEDSVDLGGRRIIKKKKQ